MPLVEKYVGGVARQILSVGSRLLRVVVSRVVLVYSN
jgi:hypothetical protein